MEEKYEVIHSFKDLKDNKHIYNEGKDFYPREGLKPTKKRITELESDKNKIGKPLIKKITENKDIETEDETLKEKETIENEEQGTFEEINEGKKLDKNKETEANE